MTVCDISTFYPKHVVMRYWVVIYSFCMKFSASFYTYVTTTKQNTTRTQLPWQPKTVTCKKRS